MYKKRVASSQKTQTKISSYWALSSVDSASHKITNLELPSKLKFHQPCCLSTRLQCRAQSSLGNTRHSVVHTLSNTFYPICYFTPIHPRFEQHLHTTGQENISPTFIELTQESTTAKNTSKGCSTQKYKGISSFVNNWACHTHLYTSILVIIEDLICSLVPLKVEAHVLLAVLNQFFLTAPLAAALAWIQTSTQSEKTWSWKFDTTNLILYILLTNMTICWGTHVQV